MGAKAWRHDLDAGATPRNQGAVVAQALASIGEGLPMSRRCPGWVLRTRSHTGHTSGSCHRLQGPQVLRLLPGIFSACSVGAGPDSCQERLGWGGRKKRDREERGGGGGELQVPNCSKR